MARFNEKYQALVSAPQEQRLYQQEKLIFEATELISRIMEVEGLSRAQLAGRLGRSKAFVTQTLGGKSNMTLRTLADFIWALGYTVELSSSHLETSRRVSAANWHPYVSTAMNVSCLPLQNAILKLGTQPRPSISFEEAEILEGAA